MGFTVLSQKISQFLNLFDRINEISPEIEQYHYDRNITLNDPDQQKLKKWFC